MFPSLPHVSCESSVSVKENPDRKKNFWVRAPHPKSLFVKFDGYKSCGSKAMFLFCHVTSRDYISKGPCDLVRHTHTTLPNMVFAGLAKVETKRI